MSSPASVSVNAVSGAEVEGDATVAMTGNPRGDTIRDRRHRYGAMMTTIIEPSEAMSTSPADPVATTTDQHAAAAARSPRTTHPQGRARHRGAAIEVLLHRARARHHADGVEAARIAQPRATATATAKSAKAVTDLVLVLALALVPQSDVAHARLDATITDLTTAAARRASLTGAAPRLPSAPAIAAGHDHARHRGNSVICCLPRSRAVTGRGSVASHPMTHRQLLPTVAVASRPLQTILKV